MRCWYVIQRSRGVALSLPAGHAWPRPGARRARPAMASLGLDLGDDDILTDGNDGSARRVRMFTARLRAQSALPRMGARVASASQSLHSGRGTRAAVLCATHAHRRPSACVAMSAPHLAHMGRSRGDRRTHGRLHRDAFWRRTSTRPAPPSAAARLIPSHVVAAGRQGSRRGAPCVSTWRTRHRRVASALLCKARFTDLRFHRTDAF